MVSVRIGELVGEFERILGGTGDIDEGCTALPASARYFAQQFEDRMAEVLRRASDQRGIAASANGDVIEQVAPFGGGERVWTTTLAVSSRTRLHLAASATTWTSSS